MLRRLGEETGRFQDPPRRTQDQAQTEIKGGRNQCNAGVCTFAALAIIKPCIYLDAEESASISGRDLRKFPGAFPRGCRGRHSHCEFGDCLNNWTRKLAQLSEHRQLSAVLY